MQAKLAMNISCVSLPSAGLIDTPPPSLSSLGLKGKEKSYFHNWNTRLSLKTNKQKNLSEANKQSCTLDFVGSPRAKQAPILCVWPIHSSLRIQQENGSFLPTRKSS